jgi:hypothetical protein
VARKNQGARRAKMARKVWGAVRSVPRITISKEGNCPERARRCRSRNSCARHRAA